MLSENIPGVYLKTLLSTEPAFTSSTAEQKGDGDGNIKTKQSQQYVDREGRESEENKVVD